MTSGPKLTVSDAVKVFDVERRTLQRMLAAGSLNGTYKDTRGRWMIPIESLHSADLNPRKTWISDATDSATQHDSDATEHPEPLELKGKNDATLGASSTANITTQHDSDATDLRRRIVQLEDQLSAEKRLREAAERNSDDLRSALRMLDAGNAPLAGVGGEHSDSRRRRWWQRR